MSTDDLGPQMMECHFYEQCFFPPEQFQKLTECTTRLVVLKHSTKTFYVVSFLLILSKVHCERATQREKKLSFATMPHSRSEVTFRGADEDVAWSQS